MLSGLYGEKHIRAIIGAAAERVDAAVVDPGAWGDVIGLFVDAFPEACVSWAFHSHDGRVRTVPGGWNAGAIEDYEAHYASVNPFAEFWATLPCNRTVVAGRNATPIGAYAHTEFVADWLDPQGDLRGAAGVRLGLPSDGVVTFVSTHYPTKRMGRYDTAMSIVLETLCERMSNVQSLTGAMVVAGERTADRSAVLARAPGTAFVVDADGGVRETNADADADAKMDSGVTTGSGAAVRLRHTPGARDRLAFRDPAVAHWFEAALARCASGLAVDCDRAFSGADGSAAGTVRVRLVPLPAIIDGAMADAFGARRTLVIVEEGTRGG